MDLIITGITGDNAPRWLKDAWKECVLPCEEFEQETPTCFQHILGGLPSNLEGESVSFTQVKIGGYFVRQDKALIKLARKAPYASAWYKQQGCPQPNSYFFIPKSDARLIEDALDPTR